jgi:hypothetical protein
MTTNSSQVAAQPLWLLDNLACVRVDGEQTADALSVVELAGRRAHMPPLHVDHATMRRSISSRAG